MLTHIFLGNPPTNVKQWIKDHYGPKLDEPLCFTAEEANSTLHLDKKGSPNAISLETSMDGNTWTDYTWSDNTGPTLTLKNVGDKVYMRAKNENQTIGSSIDDCYQFVMEGKIAASGNIQTLLKADGSRTDAPAYCYSGMFQNCRSLTTAPELPATTLASSCYNSMFSLCESLTTAPELPATTLADGCYSSMFSYCSSLTTAPELPATELAISCYESMFQGCSSLATAPALPATTLASNCYNSMFNGCTSLTTAPAIKTYTPNLTAFEYMLNVFDGAQGWLRSCNWPDLTLSDAQSMVLNEVIFGYNDPGEGVSIGITCKDGSVTAHFDSAYGWVFE